VSEAARAPVIEGLFAETPDGPRLLGSRCSACGTPYFPRSAHCHAAGCAGGRVEDAAFGPRGTLWSWAVQCYPPPPPARYDEPYEPYALGLVDLAEGLRVLARLELSEGARLRAGLPVELVLAPLCRHPERGELVTWKFRPRAGGRA
jgi:uncharacterized OB-fold protein